MTKNVAMVDKITMSVGFKRFHDSGKSFFNRIVMQEKIVIK